MLIRVRSGHWSPTGSSDLRAIKAPVSITRTSASDRLDGLDTGNLVRKFANVFHFKPQY